MSIAFSLTEKNWRPGKSLWGLPDEILKEIFLRANPATKALTSYVCKRFHRLIKVNPLDLKKAADSLDWTLIFDKIEVMNRFPSRHAINHHFMNKSNSNDLVIYRCLHSVKLPIRNSKETRVLKMAYLHPLCGTLKIGFIQPGEGCFWYQVDDAYDGTVITERLTELHELYQYLIRNQKKKYWGTYPLEPCRIVM